MYYTSLPTILLAPRFKRGLGTFSIAMYSPFKVLTRFLTRSMILRSPCLSNSPISPVFNHPLGSSKAAVSSSRSKYPEVILGPRTQTSPCGGSLSTKYPSSGTSTNFASTHVSKAPVYPYFQVSGFDNAPILRSDNLIDRDERAGLGKTVAGGNGTDCRTNKSLSFLGERGSAVHGPEDMAPRNFFDFIEDDGVEEGSSGDAVCHHGVFEV